MITGIKRNNKLNLPLTDIIEFNDENLEILKKKYPKKKSSDNNHDEFNEYTLLKIHRQFSKDESVMLLIAEIKRLNGWVYMKYLTTELKI